MNFSALIWNEPWLAPVVMNLRNVTETEDVPSAGVTPDGNTLYYNPAFWAKLNRNERLGVQLHEMLHIVNLHAARENGRQHSTWNMACDIAINYQITVSGYTLPEGTLPGENDTAENIYERLLIDVKSDGAPNRKDSLYSGSCGCCQQIDEIGGFVIGDDLLERNADGSEGCNTPDTLEAVESATKLAGQGSSPLAKRFKPVPAKADWRSILQHYARNIVGDDFDYIDYEFDEFGICEDILSPKPMAKICVLVDESGSIMDELYEQFLGELAKMSRFAKVYTSGFTDGTELNAVPLKQYERTMTGGTDVRRAYAQACEKDYDCMIILTDGYLDFPAKEPKPTIWVMPESHNRKMEVIL